MRQSLVLAGLLAMAAAPTLAGPDPEAGRFHLTLSGGGSYLDLPEVQSPVFETKPDSTPANNYFDASGWGAGGSAEIAGGLGDIFGIGLPVGVSLVGRYQGFSQDDGSDSAATVLGVAPNATAALGAGGANSVAVTQDAALWELTATMNGRFDLGEGWHLRPSIGPSILQLQRSFLTDWSNGGAQIALTSEDLDSFYAGGVVGLDLEGALGGGWSLSLALLGGFYYAHHSYDGVDSGLLGGQLSEEKDGSAWRGRASLAIAYDLGWATLGLRGGVDYLSQGTTLDRYSLLDVFNGDFHSVLRANDDLWGASAEATLAVRF